MQEIHIVMQVVRYQPGFTILGAFSDYEKAKEIAKDAERSYEGFDTAVLIIPIIVDEGKTVWSDFWG